MNYDKILNEFIDDIKKEGTYATAEELRDVLYDTLKVIKYHKDDTPEELVDKIINDNIKILEDVRNNYPIPGYTVGVRVSNINVKLFGGNIDAFERKMPDNALFDLASITKFYTQIVAYNLIKEGYFSLEDRVSDLDSRFKNVQDLTIKDVLTFTTEFKTNGRISDKLTVNEALSCLYGMEVVAKGAYNYNDLGMILMKEFMENVSGKKYSELVDKYIINKLGLLDTHLVVPKNKIELVTGSANLKVGKVNDPNALALGGYSGHAGIIASSDDLIKLGSGVVAGGVIPKDMLKDAYTPGIKDNRGIMGNTYTSHEKGVDASYVDRLEPIDNFAVQGSTRTQLNIGKNSVSTILLNPACMSIDQALEEEAKINEARALKGQNPLSLVKHFKFNHEGRAVEYDLIDARQMAPSGATVERITTGNTRLALRLRLLNKVITAYDKNFDKEINVSKGL